MALALGVGAAAGHLAGALGEALRRRRAPVVLLVVGTVRMKRVLIILAKRRKGSQVWRKVRTKYPASWSGKRGFQVVFGYSSER